MSDARTRQYTGGQVPTDPISIRIGESIYTNGGQVALLATCNATVRNHPVVYIQADDAPVYGRTETTTHGVIAQIGTATETSKIEIVETLPTDVLCVGIGHDVPGADLYLGANRFTGTLATDPVPITGDRSSAWGGGLAAMLGANAVFRRSIGLPEPELPPLSLWTLAHASADVGTGPAAAGPVDVGSAWLIGAGGVGSSLAWWLSLLGVVGPWTVIDHEYVDITNLNRSLGMFLADYRGGTTPANKANVAAALIGAEAFPRPWHDWAALDPPPPDVLIPAANDLGVRGSIAAYCHPMALTGTTSSNWTAELHLYRGGLDGCIDCRHPRSGSANFMCSTSSVPTDDGGSSDAALSFLSGTAGLLAAAALARLQHGADEDVTNHWQLAMQPALRPITSNRHRCVGGQPHALGGDVMRTLYGATRWSSPQRGERG